MTYPDRGEDRFLENFLSLSAAEVVSKGLSFAATVHLARVLGAEGFGVIGFCTALLFYFLLAVNGGFDLFGIRQVNRAQEELRRYVENIFTMRLLMALVAYGLLAACSLALYKIPAVRPVLSFYGLMLFSYALSVGWAFQAIQRVGVVALGNVCTQSIYAGAVLLIVRGPADVWRVPCAQFIAELSSVALLATAYVHRFGPLRLRIDWPLWTFIFREALPIGLSLMMSVIMLNLDAVILGFLRGEIVVGWYSAAYRIVLLLLGFSTLYHITFLPTVARFARERSDEVKDLVVRSLRLTGIFAVPVAVGGAMLAQPLMRWIYGAPYDPGVPALQIIIWSVTLTVIRLHYRNALLAFDEQKAHLRLLGWGAVINTALNLMLIPKFSLTGAAIATVCAELAVLWMAYGYVKRRIAAIPFLPALTKPALASAVMAGCLAALPSSFHLFLQMGIGMAVYFLALMMMNGISIKDMYSVYRYVQTR